MTITCRIKENVEVEIIGSYSKRDCAEGMFHLFSVLGDQFPEAFNMAHTLFLKKRYKDLTGLDFDKMNSGSTAEKNFEDITGENK